MIILVGPTLQTLRALWNQLREHAKWGDVILVVKSAAGVEIAAQEGKRPSVH